MLNGVHRGSADGKVLDDREARRSERFDRDMSTVLERAHMKLTGGLAFDGAVRLAVDHQRARTANTFTAIALERERDLLLGNEVFVNLVEHLQEGAVDADVFGFVGFETALRGRAILAPDFEGDVDRVFAH